MVDAPFRVGRHNPLSTEEQLLVVRVLDALREAGDRQQLGPVVVQQADSLAAFGDLLARYPSPLEEQRLGERRRDLSTLVDAFCESDRIALTLRAPTQAVIGRALNLAQINFFRLLWHVCGQLGEAAAALREVAARSLRGGVYTQLVEEVLFDLSTDQALPRSLRERAVHHVALLWSHRLTWRVHEFFPVLESTWEARSRVRVVGGTLLGTVELFQLLTQGGDASFVELLTGREHTPDEAMAFREFLFGRSSEELDALTARMAAENLTSIQLDSRSAGDDKRDAGSLFYEFFQARLVQAHARRLAGVPGPKRTAEGYVVMAWLDQRPG